MPEPGPGPWTWPMGCGPLLGLHVGLGRPTYGFGPYRYDMTQATDSGLKIPDIKVRYSNVGKADKCEDLWSGCSEIISQLTDKSQLNGVRVVAYCKTAFKTDGGASCRNLGYPKNQRPF